jgi:hypothetical protein
MTPIKKLTIRIILAYLCNRTKGKNTVWQVVLAVPGPNIIRYIPTNQHKNRRIPRAAGIDSTTKIALDIYSLTRIAWV